MPPLTWYLHRLRAMDAAEILGRAREKLRRRTERFAVAALRDVRLGEASGDVPALPAKADAPAALRENLAVDAANLLAGKWILFGWNNMKVSLPPNWHRDYTRGVDVPLDGRKPDHRKLPGGADARAIWEINRWAEMARLAMHGWLNDDVAAIARAQEWLADWVDRNPPGQGINWTSALEGGLRLINLCWFDALVSRMKEGRPELARGQRALVDAIVAPHVWWVHRYLSFGSSANNHRLGELTGLLLAVRRWPELERITGSANELWNQIAECILTQFAEDGGNREQALHYHLFAFEMALHATRAMNITEGPVMERLQKAAEFFVRMSHPREPWDYGDSDDGQIVPLAMRREDAVGEWSAWMCGGCSALRYWLGDFQCSWKAGSGICQVPALATTAPGKCRSLEDSWWITEESGMAVIERDGWKVRVDASPLGFGKMAAHGHCDALHVSIWDGERALVIDPGTGGYFGSSDLRAELASWNAHNGPQPVGGFRTPRRIGTFLWGEQHARPLLQCEGNGVRIWLEHEGHHFSRTVKVEGDEVVIEDQEDNAQTLCVRWRFPQGCQLTSLIAAHGQIEIVRRNLHWQMTLDLAQGNVATQRERSSPFFGKIDESPVIEAMSHGRLITTLRRA